MDEDEFFDNYQELMDEKVEQYIKENEIKSIEDIANEHQFIQFDSFRDILDDVGVNYTDLGSGSSSRYLEVDDKKYRFSDHNQLSKSYDSPDYNVAPSGANFSHDLFDAIESLDPENKVKTTSDLHKAIKQSGQADPKLLAGTAATTAAAAYLTKSAPRRRRKQEARPHWKVMSIA
jgi:hypothetical protein